MSGPVMHPVQGSHEHTELEEALADDQHSRGAVATQNSTSCGGDDCRWTTLHCVSTHFGKDKAVISGPGGPQLCDSFVVGRARLKQTDEFYTLLALAKHHRHLCRVRCCDVDPLFPSNRSHLTFILDGFRWLSQIGLKRQSLRERMRLNREQLLVSFTHFR